MPNMLQKYKKLIVKYDFINKFHYNRLTKIPKLKFIILQFKLKKYDVNSLISALSALQLLTLQKGILTTSKISNVSLKIRKGQPIGCKVILRKNIMNEFLLILINKIISNYKFKTYKIYNLFSINLKNILIFNELEQNYQFFKNVSDLNIHIGTTSCNLKEFKFLIKSFKLSL